MKKFFSLLAVLAVTVLIGNTIWAADFDHDEKTALAEIKSGVAEFDVKLYEWENSYSAITSTGTIHWDNLGDLTLFTGVKEFRCANVYALIKSTMTKANSKVYLFQNNTTNTDGHQATAGHNGEGGAGTRYDGLVEKSGTKYAIFSYQVVTKSSATANITTLPTAWKSWQPYDGVRRFYDKASDEWATVKTTNDIVIAAFNDSTNYGTWQASGDWGTTWNHEEDMIMLFGAQFSYVQDGESYGTNTITFNKQYE